MKKRNLKLIALGLTGLMGVAALTGCGSKEKSATVSTNGSTSMEEVMGALSEQYQKDNEGVKVTYDPTGSGTGIEEAKNGNTDIGLASRALKDDEKDGLEQKVIALDGISVIVNAKNGVKDLTTQQVADIFSGKITDWSQVGGKAGNALQHLGLAALDDLDLFVLLVQSGVLLGKGLFLLLDRVGLAVDVFFLLL